MVTVPIAALILLVLAAFCGGFLLGHGTGTPRCIICAKPLPRVCPDGRCGDTPRLRDSTQSTPTVPDGTPDGWSTWVDTALALGGATC